MRSGAEVEAPASVNSVQVQMSHTFTNIANFVN